MALLTLAEAKEALNITVPTYDDELADYIAGAIEAVEHICGEAESAAATDVVDVSGDRIALTQTPVLSVTSITGDYAGVLTLASFHQDLVAGVLTPKRTAAPLMPDIYTVVYTTGRSAVPAAMKQAAKVILKHQWSTQRGPQSRRVASDDASFVPGLGYAVPNAALQMLAPYDQGPAVG